MVDASTIDRRVELTTTYDENELGWVSDIVAMDGDAFIRCTLPERGRITVKKSGSEDGPWPKVFVSSWSGPDFRIRISGYTDGKYIQIITTSEPTQLEYVNV